MNRTQQKLSQIRFHRPQGIGSYIDAKLIIDKNAQSAYNQQVIKVKWYFCQDNDWDNKVCFNFDDVENFGRIIAFIDLFMLGGAGSNYLRDKAGNEIRLSPFDTSHDPSEDNASIEIKNQDGCMCQNINDAELQVLKTMMQECIRLYYHWQ